MSHALPEWRVASDTSIGSERAMTSEALMSPSELANILLEAFNTMLSECESYVQYVEQRFRLEEEHLRQVKIMLERQRDLDMRINSKLAVLPGLLPDPGRLSNLRNTWGDMRLSEMWGTYHGAVCASPVLVHIFSKTESCKLT